MKRLLVAASIAFLMAGTRVALTQPGGNPFIGHSDTGETVHLLPLPASVRSPRDTQPTFATGGSGVYAASYGSGSLSDHGGHEIPNAGFYAIYWNSSIANRPGSQGRNLRDTIAAFAGSFSLSPDYSVIQQYGSRDAIAANLRFNDVVDNQANQKTISDSSIRSYLANRLSSGMLGAPDANTLYGVYFPSGMKVTMQGGASCSSFCGYHGHFGFSYGGQTYDIKYAAFPYTDCSGCRLPGAAIVDMLTVVSSHEIREGVTDPDLNAWYDGAGYEADDKCAWHNLYNMSAGGALVQPEYSNRDNGCVVP